MAKRQSTLDKIRKKMDKLSKIHEKEEASFEEINELLEEEEDNEWDDKFEGTD